MGATHCVGTWMPYPSDHFTTIPEIIHARSVISGNFEQPRNRTMAGKNPGQLDSDTNDLRAAVQYAVMNICSQPGSADCSPRALAALSELTYLYATTMLSPDLIAFSDHANRRTITEADVRLAARRNPAGFLDKLKQMTSHQYHQQELPRTKVTAIDFQKPSKPTTKTLDLSSDDSSLDEAMLMQELDRSKAEHQVKLLDDLDRDNTATTNSVAAQLQSRNLALEVDSSDSDETENAQIVSRNHKVVSRKRFRLSAIEDSSSSSDGEQGTKFVEEPKKSRVQQILAGMSSDEENEF